MYTDGRNILIDQYVPCNYSGPLVLVTEVGGKFNEVRTEPKCILYAQINHWFDS